jgi:hypothetical protein
MPWRRRWGQWGALALAALVLLPGRARGDGSALGILARPLQVEDTSAYDGLFPIKHVTSNEWQNGVFVSEVRRRPGGAFLGLGGEQNYTLIAAGRSQVAFIVDSNPVVIEIHRAYHALHKLAPTRTAFVAYLSGREPPPHQAGATMAEIVARVEKQPPLDAARLLREARGLVSANEMQALGKMIHGQFGTLYMAGKPSGSFAEHFARMAREPRSPTRFACWLDHDQSYAAVRARIESNAIHLVTGSIAGEQTLRSIAAAARKMGVVFHHVYLSNAPDYVFGSGAGRQLAANLRLLPTNAATRVLTTGDASNAGQAAPLLSGRWRYHSTPIARYAKGCVAPRQTHTVVVYRTVAERNQGTAPTNPSHRAGESQRAWQRWGSRIGKWAGRVRRMLGRPR